MKKQSEDKEQARRLTITAAISVNLCMSPPTLTHTKSLIQL